MATPQPRSSKNEACPIIQPFLTSAKVAFEAKSFCFRVGTKNSLISSATANMLADAAVTVLRVNATDGLTIVGSGPETSFNAFDDHGA